MNALKEPVKRLQLAGGPRTTVSGFSLLLYFTAFDLPAHELEEVEVTGRRINLVGEAVSASQGIVGQQDIRIRPLLRTGEVLELVPGMVVTQHSGTGKANQYFLRGFNLDHGTDFATWVDGMPVNMRTHGHGQGYTDLNFVIPETIAQLEYKKGSHYSDIGDFSSVGAAQMTIGERFEQRELEATAGQNNFLRALGLGSVEAGAGDLAYAIEANLYDGPWSDIDEDVDKINALVKYSQELKQGRFSVTLMGYDNSWNSADQIPARAVRSGLIDELGSLDTTVGGESSRFSLSASLSTPNWQATVYGIDYQLDLFSNFTYLLDDELNGDQFQQVDERRIYGGQVQYRFGGGNVPAQVRNRVGMEVRYDLIDEVGLYRSAQGRRLGTVRSDAVDEFSAGLFYENEWQWSHHLRSVVGVRYDYFDFDVATRQDFNINGIDLRDNGGKEQDGLASFNASLIYNFNEHWEFYGSAGQGFHSNDARGTTITVDPSDGSAVATVDPLVESLGGELGVRAFWTDRLNASAALWYLELDSELLFVGDAGNTEATRASQRVGLEITSYYYLTPSWTLDLEYAWTDARYSERAPEGNLIPGSLEHVLQAGVSYSDQSGWFGSLRFRYFGERPLLEDGSVESDQSTLLNLRLGRDFESLSLSADILNLLDSDDHDIDYFYASRLPGEPSGVGVEDVHYHLLEPRTVRVSVAWRY
jgi:outer membrane cobalamin receptor